MIGRISGLWGELMAEFLGTFIILAFGDGVVAMAVAALPGSGRAATPTTIFLAAGDWLLIVFGWCFAVAFAVYGWPAASAGRTSTPPSRWPSPPGASSPGGRSCRTGPPRWLGAFVGAALVFWVYNPAIQAYNLAAHTPKSSGQALATYSIFATFPAPYFHGAIGGPLIDQIVGTAFLVMLIVAVIDARNTAVGSNLGPLIIGFIVAAIGASFGANAGYAINPARDFGPRLFA